MLRNTRWGVFVSVAFLLGGCGDDGATGASDAGTDAQLGDAGQSDAEPDAAIPPPCTENCVDTEACDDNADCVSGLCKNQVCMAATCGNATLDGTETAIDCGGLCGPCNSCAVPPADTSGSCRCEFAHYSLAFDATPNRAAYAATPNDIWAIGDEGKVLRHNGTSWRGFFAGGLPIRVVHGSGPDDVWFGGNVGSMWHWDGATLQPAPEPPGTVNGLAVVGPNDAWAVGDSGAVWRWDGSVWNTVESNTSVSLQHAYALNESDVWFVGGNGTILRWDGESLSPISVAFPKRSSIVSVWGSSPSDVWVVTQSEVYHWTGTWNLVSTPPGLHRFVNGLSTGEVWIGTPSSALLHEDGEITEYIFDDLKSVTTSGFEQPIAAASRSATVIALAHSLKRWNGAIWREAALTLEDLNDISGTSPTDIYAVGENNLLHWDGSAWSKMPTPGVSDAGSIWTFAADDIWMTHASGIYRYDGSTATLSDPATNAFALWGAAPNDLWAVGSGGSIRHWDGSSWTEETSPTTASLFEIWGSATDNVWAVGAQGAVVHWNGTDWTLNDTFPTNVTLQSVWTTGPDDVWAGGANRAVAHWDGMAWTFRSTPFVPPFFFNEAILSIAGVGTDVWATSTNSNLYRWNGTSWDVVADGQLCGIERSTKLWAAGTDLWGIGDRGQILRHVPPPP